jgi:hypothetical protein
MNIVKRIRQTAFGEKEIVTYWAYFPYKKIEAYEVTTLSVPH